MNATTSPALVNWLGITQLPESKKRMLMLIHKQLAAITESKTHHRLPVRRAVQCALEEIEVSVDISDPFRKSLFSLDQRRPAVVMGEKIGENMGEKMGRSRVRSRFFFSCSTSRESPVVGSNSSLA